MSGSGASAPLILEIGNEGGQVYETIALPLGKQHTPYPAKSYGKLHPRTSDEGREGE